MKRAAAVVSFLILAACAGLALAQAPARPRVSVVTTPDWLRPPTAADIEAVYPRRAWRDGLSGAAIVRCRVSAAGTPSDCAVLMEAPPGEGFGAAAVALANRTPLRPRTVDGRPRDGGVLTREVVFRRGGAFTYRFNFNPGDAAVLVTPLASRGRLVPGATMACPSPDQPKRTCRLHRFDWVARPRYLFQEDVIKRTEQRSGVSLMECDVGRDGGLEDCKVGGEATEGSRAILLGLAPGFKAPAMARDGAVMSGGRVLIEVDWKILAGGPEPRWIAD